MFLVSYFLLVWRFKNLNVVTFSQNVNSVTLRFLCLMYSIIAQIRHWCMNIIWCLFIILRQPYWGLASALSQMLIFKRFFKKSTSSTSGTEPTCVMIVGRLIDWGKWAQQSWWGLQPDFTPLFSLSSSLIESEYYFQFYAFARLSYT